MCFVCVQVEAGKIQLEVLEFDIVGELVGVPDSHVHCIKTLLVCVCFVCAG